MLLVLCYCWYSSLLFFFFFSSRRRHTRCSRDWSSDVCSSDLTARTRFWVPPPATTDSLFYLGISGGLGVFGFLHGDTTRVLERDIYEPNDTIPSAIDLDAARPFPTTNTLLDSLLFFNPALAFEIG